MRPAVKQPARGQEHEFEPQFGLPEKLPATEKILWQGQPLPSLMARRVFHLTVLAVYFAVMLVWRVVSQLHDGVAWNDALRGTLVLALLAATALAMLGVLARLAAQTAVYTITDKRVVMRIGIVLTVTYNLPLRSIDAAHLLPLGQGRGEIALALRGDTRIAYLQLWPHARPWQLSKPQPMLRGLADAEAVSDLLVRAWTLANAQPARAQAPAAAPAHGSVPSLATGRGAA
jgi:Bacterial PH domain